MAWSTWKLPLQPIDNREWDSFGRVRLDRHDPDSPFVGYRILTIDAGTDSRYIKSTMDEFALSLGLHLGHFAGWDITTVLGAATAEPGLS